MITPLNMVGIIIVAISSVALGYLVIAIIDDLRTNKK